MTHSSKSEHYLLRNTQPVSNSNILLTNIISPSTSVVNKKTIPAHKLTPKKDKALLRGVASL